MALKDSSGRITIDEQAAQQDIVKIARAREELNQSLVAINSMIQQASGEQGQTAQAIVEKATELKNQIRDLDRRLDETSDFIKRTITHYQEVDRQLKEAIRNAASAAVASNPEISQPIKIPTPKPPASASEIITNVAKQSQKPSSKKDDFGDFLDDAVDSISDAFSKWFKK